MKLRERLLFVVAGLLVSLPAFAHHGMGGATPRTFGQGFLSGLVHPVIGLDHVLFLLTAGVLAYSLKTPMKYVMPLLFVVSTLAGTVLHLAGLASFGVEGVVALSLILGGGLVLWRRSLGPLAAGLFFGCAGGLHGYAYAAPVLDAEISPVSAYLSGVALIQAAFLLGIVAGLGKLDTPARQGRGARSEQLAGGVAVVAGMVFLTLAIV